MIATLPIELRKSIIWDRGSEMAEHARCRIDSGIPIYFCDPRSPCRRQYWAEGADLRHLTMAEATTPESAVSQSRRRTHILTHSRHAQ